MVKFEHISLSYGNQQVIFDLSFEIPDGKFVVLIGPSGCGKTTTLKMINRLIQPNAGHIYIDGEDIAKQDKVTLRGSQTLEISQGTVRADRPGHAGHGGHAL